nr:hypothetical protein [Cohnella ginsengisoli]
MKDQEQNAEHDGDRPRHQLGPVLDVIHIGKSAGETDERDQEEQPEPGGREQADPGFVVADGDEGRRNVNDGGARQKNEQQHGRLLGRNRVFQG